MKKILVILCFLIMASYVLADCECSSGPCCDGCNYRDSDYVCGYVTEYDCYQEGVCGQDVKKRDGTQYCSGDSSSCLGEAVWGEWSLADDCDSLEVCIKGNPLCQCSNDCLNIEYISPADKSIDVEPVILKWKEIVGAESYAIYIEQEGETGDIFWPIEKTEFDEESVFATGSKYKWKVAPCLNKNNKCGACCQDDQNPFECAEYGEEWEFTTKIEQLPAPELESPENNSVVNFSDSLKWERIPRARSYCSVLKTGSTETRLCTDSVGVQLSNIWEENLQVNTEYSWKVQPCANYKGADCQDTWSDEWTFKTAGAKPLGLSSETTSFPVKLSWEESPSALSYRYEVTSEALTKNNQVLIDYPDIEPETDYSWKVRSCADEQGLFCGDWSETQKFTTLTLGKPSNPLKPEDKGVLFTYERNLSWESVSSANAYQYRIDVKGQQLIQPTIVYSNSAFVSLSNLAIDTTYYWYVQSCLDKECQETSDWAGPWEFTLVQSSSPRGVSIPLVPCGQNEDDARTSWNERDTCEFKHLFILLKNILDFLLWRVSLVILGLLALAAGAMYYFGLGSPDVLNKTQAMLKSGGTGFLLMLLAWFIVNMVVKLLGYTIKWWIITF